MPQKAWGAGLETAFLRQKQKDLGYGDLGKEVKRTWKVPYELGSRVQGVVLL